MSNDDSNTDATSTVDAWYDAYVRLDGGEVEVWWGEEGGTLERIAATADAGLYAGEMVGLYASEDTDAHFGDVVLTFPDPSTVLLEYNSANESEEMAAAISGGRQALRSNAERLTKMTEDSEPDITLTYDGWERMIAREQTVSVSNRSDSSICPISTFLFASFSFRKEKEEGDKLKLVDTDFPGETDVSFIYDGSLDTLPLARVSGDAAHSLCECPGKRRYKAVDPDGANTVTWRRWARPSDDSLDVSRGETSGEAAHLRGKCAGWNVLAEYADTGDFWDIGTMETSYTHDGMSVLGETPGADPSSSTYRCYLHDHPEQMGNICGGRQALRSNAERLGSTRALYDDDKVILASIEHLPYGAFLSTAGASEDPGGMPTFTGKPYDAELGLYYFPYRYYSPDTGQWLTTDPLGMVDGPNIRSYGMQNPAFLVDLEGTSCGPGPLGDILVPDKCPPFLEKRFGACCDEHDDCYGCKGYRKGTKKKDCDKQLRRCMQDQCEWDKLMHHPMRYRICRACAQAYYQAVRRLGGIAFWRARTKARKKCCEQ